MNREKRREIFRRLRDANPTPTTELRYNTPFELLVAVILSAQATDKGVNKATEGLFSAANTPRAILDLGEDGLKRHIRTIGLFNSKAKNIIQTCAALLTRHGGEVPRERKALEALPGVGRKTANVVLGNAFGVPGITVDTHVGRLARRLGWTRNTDPVKVEADIAAILPPEEWTMACHRLIFHGRRVCTARRPACESCGIVDLCPRIGVGTAPRARTTRATTTRRGNAR